MKSNNKVVVLTARIIAIMILLIIFSIPAIILYTILTLLLGPWGAPAILLYIGIGGNMAVYRAGKQGGMNLIKVFKYWFLWPVVYFTDK